ncbi:sensor histidine kinase [Prauserella cavernicola]|uniref:histidine kinase n=1 Tax=Prauserella cavernicola TaxID=2800127 RepID=A0A934V5V6_9PSEU|nr:HAMP domain-containing sensor histidine kinase [Prauserella cavernicola]MBK1785023.1 HAMP domain-containing protein [Prauserella cavernicola]
MSSSRPRVRRPWSLRSKLLAQLIGLLAVVCLLVVVVTEFALDTFLVGKLDEQLRGASDRARAVAMGPPPELRPGEPRPKGPLVALDAPGQGVETLTAVLRDGEVVRAQRLTGPEAERQLLPNSSDAVLTDLPADGRAYSRDLGDFGSYRLSAMVMGDGTVLVTGLPLSQVDDTLLNVGLIIGGVALGAVTITGLVGAWTVRRTLRPLDRLATTASKVTELPLDKGEVALSVRVPEPDTDTRTEVGKVGLALNQMLGHVSGALDARQRSESRVRQFVADASHELRTPLAAIKGYAELVGRHGDAVPNDVRFAFSRVESESARMTNLVEELLLLARLDAGRAPVREPVDLSRLVADAVADAHVAGPGHRWVLDAPAEPITVKGDAEQLHQVVANLLSNARAHTPSGSRVEVVLARRGDSAVLKVHDDGPGIPAPLLPEVFERFARGDTSRSRSAGSTGLGLAIVAAVVAAHHGEVAVTSEPGATEFTLALPVSAAGRAFA